MAIQSDCGVVTCNVSVVNRATGEGTTFTNWSLNKAGFILGAPYYRGGSATMMALAGLHGQCQRAIEGVSTWPRQKLVRRPCPPEPPC